MSTQIILKVLALRHRLRQRDRWTRRQLEAHQTRELRLLREHAYAHSPFYGRLHKKFTDRPIDGLPVLTKEMVMENGKYSDERFIDAMVPHHQGAIAMAEVALQNAEHEEIKDLSRNMVSTQRTEIEELKSIKKKEFGTSNVPMEMSQEQMRGMDMMMDPQRLANREPFDEAFIGAMIPHHQSAIEMAKVAYEKSENARIKELARNIVSAQKREIEQMQRWRGQWYPEG